MKKMRLIGTIIGVAGAIGAVAAVVYKKFKEKQAMVNTPQEKCFCVPLMCFACRTRRL